MHYTHAMNWKNGIAFFSLASILFAQSAGDAWWAHVQALAAPGMEGRLTGSEGYLRAAKYVVAPVRFRGTPACRIQWLLPACEI